MIEKMVKKGGYIFRIVEYGDSDKEIYLKKEGTVFPEYLRYKEMPKEVQSLYWEIYETII